jgi:valyl-tRNA synthetase
MATDDKELPSAYIAKEVEPKWSQRWEECGVFRADASSSKPAFCVMMPPPNVTGILHVGHALVNTLVDILTRWKKMSGFEALWLPGTDHAGIATQTVVERNLMKSHGKRRVDFSREEFLEHVWAWKEKSQHTIHQQIRAMGCACDWSKTRFTMDDQSNKAVRHAFKKLFDKGLIYRGLYLVNWDPVTGTALADDEVEYEEREGFLWTIRYPLVGGEHSVFVATTRPETMLGDTAVAVHPHDKRYQHLIGLEVDHPITGRRIPIIADEFVDPEFGTGIVKITPAHDPADYQFATRHNIPMINILTKDGKINEEGGRFQGLSVLECREAVVSTLQKEGLLVRTEPYTRRVGVSYRSKAIIEPMLSLQWFVRLSSFKDVLRNYVAEKKVTLIPSQLESTYYQWINNLHDWCISRQLWWGHRIPVWYQKDNHDIYICHDGEGVPEEVAKDPEKWVQDSDVLDTWFSAALWPFSTLGWPDNTDLLKKFYPNSTLITGNDLLFFWIARMIMMGHFALEKPPFHETFLHGLIYGKSYWRDQASGGIAYVSPEEKKAFDLGKVDLPRDVKSRWEKMSKSKGNVLDPMEIIDEYGADAMRLTLSYSVTDASIIELDRRRFEDFRHFVNKIWNGARFVLTNLVHLADATIYEEKLDSFELEDKWILSRLSATIASIESHLHKYAFDKATQAAYQFFWDEFCSFYIEIAKSAFGTSAPATLRSKKQVLALLLLIDLMRMLHPFAPFITEELFTIIKQRFGHIDPSRCASSRVRETLEFLKKEFLAETPYPKAKDIDENSESLFAKLQEASLAIRAIRGEMKIAPSISVEVFIVGNEPSPIEQLIRKHEYVLKSLVRISKISYEAPKERKLVSRAPVDAIEIVIPLPQELRQQEEQRVRKSIEKLRASSERGEKQLEGLRASEKTPQEVLSKLSATLEQQKKDLRTFEEQLQSLQE